MMFLLEQVVALLFGTLFLLSWCVLGILFSGKMRNDD